MLLCTTIWISDYLTIVYIFFLLLNKFQGPLETIFLVIAPHEIETQHGDFVEKKYIILGRIFSSHTNHYISYQ